MAGRAGKQSFEALDALRGIAAIWVCVDHAYGYLMAPVIGESLETHLSPHFILGLGAKLAVFLFFALSGFVISLSVTRNAARHGTFDPLEYAIARIARISPPLIFVLLLAIGLSLMLGALNLNTLASPQLARNSFIFEPVSPTKCLLTLCGTGALAGGVNGPLWTLEIEIQLYVIAGLLSWAAISRRWRCAILAALVLYLIACFRPWRDGHPTIQPFAFAAFAFGWWANRAGDWLTPPRAAIGSAVLATLFVAGVAVTEPRVIYAGLRTSAWVMSLLLIFGAASALGSRALAQRRFHPLLAASGRFSYTLYVLHYPLLLAVAIIRFRSWPDRSFGPSLLFFLTVTVLIVALSAWLATRIERPRHAQRIVRRWLERTRLLRPHQINAAP